jgi:2-succinyl-5-enolpyruvyl-6-hydroxy-3-cyclohexene-1-carboxylate synthase
MSAYRLQPILNMAEICVRKGIRKAVICPGSRSAPLNFAFGLHPDIQSFSIVDERVAGFMALGMAQQSGLPSVLICTSGTAGLNFAPALTEAYYLQIPLLVLTADRPAELIDQADGQTIRQREMYGKHCKAAYELPLDYENIESQKYIERIVSEAINCALSEPKGPVHINCPFREPFYPESEDQIRYDSKLKIIEQWENEKSLSETSIQALRNEWQQAERVWIVGGQADLNPTLCKQLDSLSLPVFADIISNLHPLQQKMRYQDLFLAQEKALPSPPDLLITFGMSLVSKNLKNYLRKNKAKQHWHLQTEGIAADTFHALTKVIPVKPLYFFEKVISPAEVSETQKKYTQEWLRIDQKVEAVISHFFDHQPFSEMEAVYRLMQVLPANSCLHLANSMSVRYANVLHFPEKKAADQGSIRIYSNRGTSGIDGCLSTAIGHALVDDAPHFVILGDLSFFYDRNALFHQYLPPNLHILVLNNQGGGIFNMIQGPKRIEKAASFFLTPHHRTVHWMAQESELPYFSASDRFSFESNLRQWLDSRTQTSILEVQTDMAVNTSVWQTFKKAIHIGQA